MAQKLDPNCAMCFWGEALVLGPNINLPMQEDAVAPAYSAAQKAKALAANASPRERALIGALAARYGNDPSQGGALFRTRAVQLARDHPGTARSRRRHPLCQGDVALHARHSTGGAP
jgi:hypothetical protein